MNTTDLTDQQLLFWVHERLRVLGDSANYQHMIRLRRIAGTLNPEQLTTNKPRKK